jgi:hypothetical protein
VEIRARQRRKVPVPDSVPLKNIGYMPVPVIGFPLFLPRLFPCSIVLTRTLLCSIFPHSHNGKGRGIVDLGYIFSPQLQSRTKSGENVFPVETILRSHACTPEPGRFWPLLAGFLIPHSILCRLAFSAMFTGLWHRHSAVEFIAVAHNLEVCVVSS